jgi:hypothetical protein
MREAKANYDAMVRTARDLGVETPALDALGRYLEPRIAKIDPPVRAS